MAGKTKEFLSGLLEKTTPRELMDLDVQRDQLMYNVFGFLPATDGTDNALVLSNLGFALSQQGYHVCLLDFKVFYPNLFLYLDVEQNERGKGLLTVLKDDRADLREEITPTKYEGLYLLSPSPQDLMEEYFDFDVEKVSCVVETLKRLFDIVLIDIPNVPPLEFCIGAMKECHVGFFTATERVDALSNITRLMDFVSTLGIGVNKFTNIIFTNLQDVKFDFNSLKKLRFDIVAGLPLIKGIITDALEGKIYVKDNPLVNGTYKKELGRIVEKILQQG